jgi:hypothetical protein
VPSRLTTAQLRQLLADGGQPAGPPTIGTGDARPGPAIEVDRLVSTTGLIGLAGRRHPVGSHVAGRRLTVRLDRGLLQLVDHGVLLRSLPNLLTLAEQTQLRDARPAGPPPAPPPNPSPDSRSTNPNHHADNARQHRPSPIGRTRPPTRCRTPMPSSAQQREARQQLLQVHDLPRDELGDGEPDDVGDGVEIGHDAPHLRTDQPVRFSAEPEHDLIAVDGIHIEVDRDPGAARAGQPVQQRPGAGPEIVRTKREAVKREAESGTVGVRLSARVGTE